MTEREALTAGYQYHQGGDLLRAEQVYRSVLDAYPESSDARYLLGLLASQQGQNAISVRWFDEASKLAPDNAEILSNLGRAYCLLDNFQDGYAAYCRASVLQPTNPDIHNDLGATLQALEQFDSAKIAYERSLELRPDNTIALNNLGLLASRIGEFDDAIRQFHRSLEIKPTIAETHFNLGVVFQSLYQLNEAEEAYRTAIELNPNFAEAYSNLATVLHESGCVVEAIESYQKAIVLNPNLAVTHKNLGNAFRELHQHDLAINAYESALKLNPDYSEAAISLVQEMQQICRWDGAAALAQQVMMAVESDRTTGDDLVPPFSFVTLPIPTSSAQQLRCAQKWSRTRYRSQGNRHENYVSRSTPKSDRKISVGYLSADFHQHATAWLIAELFEVHDREQFTIFGYSTGPDDQSLIRKRITCGVDIFRDMSHLPYRIAAEQIRADQIDILVDLKGHTRYARTEILSERPAPIQVHFLGYPGTMGTDFIDYILVDEFVVPLDRQAFYSEQLIYLPGCYQVNDARQNTSPEIPTRTECGLPESGFVFCSFNNSYKITPEMFDVWMRILKATPGSVLWLLESNPQAKANLRREARLRRVDESRLVFAPPQPNDRHLARHKLADLFLDTYPVCAHTTASDALRMGLPIVTLSGEAFVSRVAGSLLHTLDLDDWIASNLDDYESMALKLAHEPAFLSQVRCKVTENLKRSDLYDGKAFARKVEHAYRSMMANRPE
ncbi:MAG: tetratricopeptide repeat protein [Pirellulaceae bacterium]|nr:tetratricopeptide repeat protein [Pirellulaceae bacterium]